MNNPWMVLADADEDSGSECWCVEGINDQGIVLRIKVTDCDDAVDLKDHLDEIEGFEVVMPERGTP